MTYLAPTFKSNSFTCPFCNTISEQKWDHNTIIHRDDKFIITSTIYPNSGYNTLSVSTCYHCKKFIIWLNDKIIDPIMSNIPLPNNDMPEIIKQIYNEAREVFPISRKSAAALLRLAVQRLFIELGEKGKNINDDIKNLVQKGLAPDVQKSLDILRVTGNNAVHPGEIDLDENIELTSKLFYLMNFIVEELITKPKEIEKLFSFLPEKDQDNIAKRDNK